MLPVTSAVAALAAVALVLLSVRVSLRRMAVGTRIGTGDDETLLRRIRAQGNFIEYVLSASSCSASPNPRAPRSHGSGRSPGYSWRDAASTRSVSRSVAPASAPQG
ncbi:hypothetical protein ABGN05_25330 [Aquibium sp. LZ166]|uniref:Uncharacterized protein n=1 Tax=Aquibium pacificus TaxID=3153579 RepID=A0ABV3SQ97_9HYPH